jgi:hypothetical protein
LSRICPTELEQMTKKIPAASMPIRRRLGEMTSARSSEISSAMTLSLRLAFVRLTATFDLRGSTRTSVALIFHPGP